MWFIDPSLIKNKKFYIQETKNDVQDIEIYIYYGEELFSKLFKRTDLSGIRYYSDCNTKCKGNKLR